MKHLIDKLNSVVDELRVEMQGPRQCREYHIAIRLTESAVATLEGRNSRRMGLDPSAPEGQPVEKCSGCGG